MIHRENYEQVALRIIIFQIFLHRKSEPPYKQLIFISLRLFINEVLI